MIAEPAPRPGKAAGGAPARPDQGALPSALGGVRVVEFGHGAAGAQAGMVLADFGAEVVAVRPPVRVWSDAGWTGAEPAWGQWDRGKTLRTLDLDDPGDRAAAAGLVHGADVVVDGLAEGKLARFGLGASELRNRHPALVVATIRGSDPVSGAAALPGHDPAVLAATGRTLEMGRLLGWDRPAWIPVPLVTFAAAQATVQGVLAALHARRRTGVGDLVRASLVRSVAAYDVFSWLGAQFPDLAAASAKVAARAPGTPFMGYLTARAADGRWLQFANWAPHLFWAQLESLGLGGLRARPGYEGLPFVADDAVFEAVWEEVLEVVAARPAQAWMDAALDGRRFGVEIFRGGGAGMDHPQVRHNGDVVEVGEPGSLQLAPIADLSATPGKWGRAPAPGACSPEAGHLASPADRRRRAARRPEALLRPGALGDVTVVELATMLDGPYGPSLLAEQGARVIKVESLDGDPMRQNTLYSVKTQQGKESIALDIKSETARPVVAALIQRADILVENFRPGVAERLGLAYADLARSNPGLIYVHASGYGPDGPYAGLPAYHPTPGAVCGNAVLQSGEGFPPNRAAELDAATRRSVSRRLAYANEGHPDSVSAVAVATAALLALVARDATGMGQEVTTTMLRSNGYLMGAEWVRTPHAHGAVPRPDPELLGVGPLRRLYRCAEGWILVDCVTRREREALAAALHEELHEELDDHDEAALARRLEACFAGRDADVWVALLGEAGAPCVRADAGTPGEVLRDDPWFRSQEMVVDTVHPDLGPHFRQGALVRLDGHPPVLGPGTRVGEHTLAVLAELGFEVAEIERLRDLGVVTWPDGRS